MRKARIGPVASSLALYAYTRVASAQRGILLPQARSADQSCHVCVFSVAALARSYLVMEENISLLLPACGSES